MFARHHYDFIERNSDFGGISSILELGPGDGALLKLIRKRHVDIELFSVEPSKDLCENLRKLPGLHVINAYVENAVLERRFDLVIMSDVLERLENPARIIRHVHDNLLETGGHLYIDIPNQDFELASPGMASMAPATHLYFFSGERFHEILSGVGFAGENIRGAKYATIPGKYISRMEIISNLKRSNRFFDRIRLYREKAINRASILTSAPARVLAGSRPAEIPLDQRDSRYNNVAIIARK